MKEKLTIVFNALKQVETKGASTLIMADCMRELVKILDELPDKETETDK